MKTLTLDIEMFPNIAHVWDLWEGRVGINQLQESATLACMAWKWHGHDQIHFARGDELDRIWTAVDTADAIITYNGNKFDLPHLNREFIEHGYEVPAPYASIDLYQTVRRVFKFPSNKLDYVAGKLLGEHKEHHEGHTLWTKCMNGDEDAWDRMQSYNEQDVRITEMLYDKLLPWIRTLPNVRLYTDDEESCPRCGSHRWQKRGIAKVQTGSYQQYKCLACSSWFRGVKRVGGSDVR